MLNLLELLGFVEGLPGDKESARATLIAAIVSATIAGIVALVIFLWVRQ